MSHAFELQHVTKRFGKTLALNDVSLVVSEHSLIGLVGKNGSGKTTLIRHITGLYLPTSGQCTTLGCPTPALGHRELSRIGVVNQRGTFIEWMRVEQFLRYVESFYETWDRDLETRLISALDIDLRARIGTMSPGNLQKVGLVVATCYHPELLLLDEPLSDLDPIAREEAIVLLLERFSDDKLTILISSHMLRDIERIVDRVVCMDAGRIVADTSLDALKDRYAEWIVTSRDGRLPEKFAEDYVISSEGDRFRARLVVDGAAGRAAEFAISHGAEVEATGLNLEHIFPLLVSGKPSEKNGNRNKTAKLVAANAASDR